MQSEHNPLDKLSSTSMNRRRFLGLTAGTAGLVVASQFPIGSVLADGPFNSYPFTLGVASGDPLPDAVVIWTRLAPEPLSRGGGMPNHEFPVRWQMATDERMSNVVREGTALARPEYAHTVHVDVRGLQPNREYFYQFKAANEISSIGRTRTAPAKDSPLDSLKFAIASCQNYSQGYYTPYPHLVNEDLAFVIWLGDYIYEGPGSDNLGRSHVPHQLLITLDDFRTRYAQFKSDPNLQAAHAAFPWMIMEDDHDVRNNYAGYTDPYGDSYQDMAVRRANGYRAQWEHSPLRYARMPDGPNYPLYRRFTYGDLATFNILDEREYRSAEIEKCSDDERTPSGYCPEALDPSRTMLGDAQLSWLLDGLGSSATKWNVLGNPVFFTQRDHDSDPDERDFNKDTWDGYVADRQKILDFIQERDIKDMVIVTGDSHQNWVQDTPPNYYGDWDAYPVATEFLGTSITSGGDRTYVERYYFDQTNNPQLLFQNNSHGYVTCALTSDVWHTYYRVVDSVESQESPVRTLSTWAVENGNPGARLVSKG